MKTRTRTGKIARLPRKIREQLNRRLENGEPGNRLVEWLNSLPEVQKVVAADFDGEPVSEPNLSRWRQGGYQDWLEQQESLEAAQQMAEDGPELTKAAKGRLSDHTAVWLLARELAAVRRLKADAGQEAGWKRLREFCADLVRLRRGDQQSRRLALAEERWARKKQTEDAGKGPPDWQLTAEERQERINEIYGRPIGWRPDQWSQPGNQENDGETNLGLAEPAPPREPLAVLADGVSREESCEQPPAELENEPLESECGIRNENADERAKNELMGRDQVALPSRIWAAREGSCKRAPVCAPAEKSLAPISVSASLSCVT